MAKLIDALLSGFVMTFVRIWYSDLIAIGAMYLWLIACDGWGSWGKWLLNMRCVHAETGKPCSLFQSVQRNVFFVPGGARAMLVSGSRQVEREWLGGLAAFGLLLVALEMRWMTRRADKRRLGDAFGNTRVVMGRAPLFG